MNRIVVFNSNNKFLEDYVFKLGRSLNVRNITITNSRTLLNKISKIEGYDIPDYLTDILSSNLILFDVEFVDDGVLKTLERLDKNYTVFEEDKRILTYLPRPLCCPYKWARRVKRGEPYYECSSKGDKRFSAIYARLKKYNNRSIEEIYQMDFKGYRKVFKHWKFAKGKPPLGNISKEELFKKYVGLWEDYFKENTELLEVIRNKAIGRTITDMFGVTDINQARAICYILNDKHECERSNK